jgi:hypothetical protein
MMNKRIEETGCGGKVRQPAVIEAVGSVGLVELVDSDCQESRPRRKKRRTIGNKMNEPMNEPVNDGWTGE